MWLYLALVSYVRSAYISGSAGGGVVALLVVVTLGSLPCAMCQRSSQPCPAQPMEQLSAQLKAPGGLLGTHHQQRLLRNATLPSQQSEVRVHTQTYKHSNVNSHKHQTASTSIPYFKNLTHFQMCPLPIDIELYIF